MIPQQSYIIESILATGILYVIYFLALRNRPMLIFNRFMLLGMPVLGMILPLINFSLPQNSDIPTSSYLMEEVFVNAEYQYETEALLSNYQYLYLLVVFILLVFFIFQVIHIIRLRKESELLYYNTNTYNLINGNYPHFSFFNQVYINNKLIDNVEELETIMEHERVHVKQWHSLDIIIFEVLKLLFWFNPFIWLFKKLAIENHEYLADRGMINKTSKNLVDYFNELLQNSLFTYKITLANNFNNSLLKKRVIMMTKKLKTVERLIPLFILPILIFVGIFFACTESNQILGEQIEEEVTLKTADPSEYGGDDLFFIVEEMPLFNGGNHMQFRDYVTDSLVYPKEALEKGIVGRVFVQFIVGTDGKVHDATVVRSADPLLDAEALRVVNSSPDWTPGKQRGQNVAVQFTFPIVFQTEEKKVEETKSAEQYSKISVSVINGVPRLNLGIRLPSDGDAKEELTDKFNVQVEFYVNDKLKIENLTVKQNENQSLLDDVYKLVDEQKLLAVIKESYSLDNEYLEDSYFNISFAYQPYR